MSLLNRVTKFAEFHQFQGAISSKGRNLPSVCRHNSRSVLKRDGHTSLGQGYNKGSSAAKRPKLTASRGNARVSLSYRRTWCVRVLVRDQHKKAQVSMLSARRARDNADTTSSGERPRTLSCPRNSLCERHCHRLPARGCEVCGGGTT
ncbi:hypothetical protein EVAR_47418_1 [Eumeta japonica]|uniref:Uncharacterized protein n=1 Tax=Eumeta variegata TaxID=151549 RepID=A0A4C1Y181_EUMVA|nr:hypothetical protein EVAR_47418_1 [Eumeta japonica]